MTITIEQIAGRLAIAQLAIDLVVAENEISVAKGRYIEKIQKFEKKHGAVEGRLSRNKPEHSKVLAYTDEVYATYRRAIDDAYNVKRRLATAVRQHQRGAT
jgi:hypothetical protein